MKSVPLILRGHRDDLWRRWAEALAGAVDEEYAELIDGPLGERMLRELVEDLVTFFEVEEYELPGLLRSGEARATADARHRLDLGFKVCDLVVALQALRGAAVDVLIDALLLDEMPPYAVGLDQLKRVDAYLDRMILATAAAAW